MGQVLRVFSLVVVVCLVSGAALDDPEVSGPLNFAPVMVLRYLDPASGDLVECGPGCRRLKVPEGVDLEVAIRVENADGNVTGQGLIWDLWFNQPLHPYPGVRLEDCRVGVNAEIDVECWRDLGHRVDRAAWDEMTADRVCVPSSTRNCRDQVIRVRLDPAFDGARRRGTYHFALWVDRFQASADENEYDNFVGPVRVSVVPSAGGGERPEQQVGPDQVDSVEDDRPVVFEPTVPKPWTAVIIEEASEAPFILSSDRSLGILEFDPVFPGPVEIEVEQIGNPQVLIVEVRKASTGEVLAEIRDRGRISLSGNLGREMFKNDRRFEVVVRSAARPQGLRGLIRVSYPGRALYMPSN